MSINMIRDISIWLRAVVWASRHPGNFGTEAIRRESGAHALSTFHIFLALTLLIVTELVFGYKGLLSWFRRHGVDWAFIPMAILVVTLFYRYSYKTTPLRKERVQLNRCAIIRAREMSGMFWRVATILGTLLLLILIVVLGILAYPARGGQY